LDAIIPAAGLATRMRGIPKFLLPCDEIYTSLIERHVKELIQVCETIWIPTRPDLVMLFETLGISEDRIVVLPVVTDNMSQTVNRVMQISSAKYFCLTMPDTFFYGELPYGKLNPIPEFAELALWKIREDQKGKLGQVSITPEGKVVDIQDKVASCDYPLFWGALTFSSKIQEYINVNEPHIGYAVKSGLDSKEKVDSRVFDGEYFDCGTPSEYLKMLEKVIRE
jgi:choline kinase